MEDEDVSSWSDAQLEATALNQGAGASRRGAAKAELTKRARKHDRLLREGDDLREVRRKQFDEGLEQKRQEHAEKLMKAEQAHADALIKLQQEQAETIANKQLLPAKSSARATTFAAVAAGLSAVAALVSAGVAIEGGTDTHNLALAANKQADLAHIQAEAASGAFCNEIVSTTSNLPYLYFAITCEQGGASIAAIKGGNLSATLFDLARNTPMGEAQHLQIAQQVLKPKGTSKQINFSVPGFSPQEYYGLRQSVVIRGSFTYDNGFGRTIPVNFCDEFIPFRDNNGAYNGNANVPCDWVPERLAGYKKADAELQANRQK